MDSYRRFQQHRDVDLTPAFVWTCPCGVEQFVKAASTDDPDAIALLRCFFPEMDPKCFRPGYVACASCGEQFAANLDHHRVQTV